MMQVSLILLAVFSLPPAAYAADDTPFNVDFFCGWGVYYRPMEWTPVEIGISSTLTEPFAGLVTVSAQQDGLNTMNIAYEFVLTPDIPQHLPLVTKFAFATDKCSVRISDQRGRTQWHYDFDLWDFSEGNRLLTAVNEQDMLIGIIGRGRFGLLRLPERSVCRLGDQRGRVYIGDKLPRMVPWDWTGFVCLDLLILYDPDWDTFNRQQLNAIAQWISNGGKLLLVLGSHPLPSANPIAQLLPFELQEVKQTVVSPKALEQWRLISDKQEIVNAWPLVPKSDARFYEAQTYDANECLFATGYAGFGRVGVLAFEPSAFTDSQQTNSAQFWVSHIQAILQDAQSTSYGTSSGKPLANLSNQFGRSIGFVEDAEKTLKQSSRNLRRYEVGLAQGSSNAVMEFLYQGIKPLSIWWVILLLVALAVLLGPLDYKILKHFGRLPLTWLTCAFWIILFTIGAYYGVQMIHGGETELRVVSVLDGIENRNGAWSTNYCGLFAPYSDDYQLEDLDETQWWSGIAPTQEYIRSYDQELSTRNIYCFQHDGGNLPYSLPINIWSIQCLLNESFIEQLPFYAEVEQEGNVIVLRISNQSDSPILNGSIFLGMNRGANFGPVPARTSKQFHSKLRNMRIWGGDNTNRYRDYYSRRGYYTSRSFKKEDAFFAQGCLQRTQTISAYLDRGAAIVFAEYDQAPVSFTVKDRSYNPNHIQLARLVVFPKEQQGETENDRNQESN